MRALHLISSAGLYGAEAMILQLLRALTEAGHETLLGVFRNEQNPHTEIAQRARKLSLNAIELPCSGRIDLSTVREIKRRARDFGADLVHSHGYKANVYSLLANVGGSRPLVSTCHNWTSQTRSIRAYAYLDRFILRRFDRIFSVSEDVMRALEQSGVSTKKISVIPNGITLSDFASAPPAAFTGVPAGTPLIGMVGRLVEAKGFQYVLESAPEALTRFPDAYYVLVGDGPYRNHLAEQCDRLGITSHVVFAGKRDDMPCVYRSLTMLVLPSLNEGMPMTLLEAMAARIPVIASRVGGIPKMICEGETGLLTGPGDVQGLRQAIETLLSDCSFRCRLGEGGRRWVAENASVGQMAQNYVAQYRDVLNS
jgi:glycosyltransferase involved in cell wall biosynthesis